MGVETTPTSDVKPKLATSSCIRVMTSNDGGIVIFSIDGEIWEKATRINNSASCCKLL